MTREEYLGILIDCDDPIAENPRGYNSDVQKSAERKFLILAENIQRIMDCSCEVESGRQIQDASFLGQIILPMKISKHGEDGIAPSVLNLRVSKFGNMATISDDIEIKDEEFTRLKKVIEATGYLYIPYEILIETYSGKDQGVDGLRNWWERFFDYT